MSISPLRVQERLRSDAASHILRAAQNAVPLDERQINAVAARIELDLRLGAVFTRFQTLILQALGGDLADQRIISYGTLRQQSRF